MQFLLQIIAALFVVYMPAMSHPVGSPNDVVNQARSAQDCADPTITQELVVGFGAAFTWHAFAPRWVFINDETSNGVDWELQGPAWVTPQDFTTAFWELSSLTSDDLIMALGNSDGSAPVIPGYFAQGVRGYVYSTQVYGSVPLFGVFQQTQSDHYYTMSAAEHSSLVGAGWTDVGTVVAVQSGTSIRLDT